MAQIVVIGAGLSGTLMAYELVPQLRKGDHLTLIGQDPTFHFVPSNPWVAIGWRKPADIKIDLTTIAKRKNIHFITAGAKRVHPDDKRIEIEDGSSVDYDYLVIATGPELAFDEIPGFGPEHLTQSVCHVDHAARAFDAFEKFCAAPGPIVVGAVQGASCFGPAYEFALILDTELKRRGLRDRVPMTFVTPEPYIGHLGLDGVGDTKTVLESELRERHIKWITNARVKAVADGGVEVEEVAEGGAVAKTHQLPLRLCDDDPRLPRRRRRARYRETHQSTRLYRRRQVSAQSNLSGGFRGRRLRRHPAGRGDAGAGRRAENQIHDQIHGYRHSGEYRRAATWKRRLQAAHLECGLSRRFRRRWRCFRGAAAEFHRVTSTGRRRAVGFTSPKSLSKNTFCAKSAAARANPSMNAT